MDNVTHTLFAVTLARTPLARAGRGTTAALVIASNAPDVDVMSLARGGANYMHWHRGPTHGPLGVVGLGLIAAAGVWLWNRLKTDDEGRTGDSASFPMLLAISMLGVALHIGMDLPTSYGTRFLSPFDWHWYAFDWLPIVDIYLLIALVAGLAFGRGSEAARRRNAAIVLSLMAANYGLRGAAHHQALAVAPRLFGPTLPGRCPDAPDTSSLLDRWPRTQNAEHSDATAGNPPPGARRCLVEVAAVPTFSSPFDWHVIAQYSNAYEVRDVDLTDARFRSEASSNEVMWRQVVRYPNVWTPAAAQAAAAPLGRIFLGFSRFPAARTVTDREGTTVVRFIDMRFAAGLVALEQPALRRAPFSATFHVDAAGRIVDASLGR